MYIELLVPIRIYLCRLFETSFQACKNIHLIAGAYQNLHSPIAIVLKKSVQGFWLGSPFFKKATQIPSFVEKTVWGFWLTPRSLAEVASIQHRRRADARARFWSRIHLRMLAPCGGGRHGPLLARFSWFGTFMVFLVGMARRAVGRIFLHAHDRSLLAVSSLLGWGCLY